MTQSGDAPRAAARLDLVLRLHNVHADEAREIVADIFPVTTDEHDDG